MAMKATKISFFIYVMRLHLDFYIKNVALQEIILQADVLRAIQAKPVSVGSCATLVEWSRWQALQRLLHDCKGDKLSDTVFLSVSYIFVKKKTTTRFIE